MENDRHRTCADFSSLSMLLPWRHSPVVVLVNVYLYRERIHCTLEGGCLYVHCTNNYNVTCAIHNEWLTLSVSGSGISGLGGLWGADGNWMFSVPASVTELFVVQDWAEAEDPYTEALLAKRFKEQKSCVRFTSRRFDLDDW